MKIYENGIYREMTDAEIAEMEEQSAQAAAMERKRPLSEGEVLSMLLKAQVNTLAVDDQTALRMMEFYPEWEPGVLCGAGFKARRNGKLWRSIQSHTSQPGWEPENAPALWAQINETHAGTLDDPIPYEGNMALESGKYYLQGGEIYLCNRDTVNPVYNLLAELVGIYVEVCK